MSQNPPPELAKAASDADFTGLPAGAPPSPPPPAEAPPPNPAASPVDVDSAGVPFDPARHVAKKHPNSGRWLPKGGRKPASGSSAPPAAETVPEIGPDGAGGPSAPGAPSAPPPKKLTLARQNAEGIAVSLYTLGSLVIDGGEWMPESADEHEALVGAWEHYFEMTGAKEMPPWIAPAVATAVFCGKRWKKPATRTFLGKIKAWGWNVWAGWRGRRESAALNNRTGA